MNEIGKKLKELRKKKGLSQEELAESASVNLRTIQRIENNESEPRGNTLNQICKVLNINAEDILDYGKQTDNSYLFFFHLSVLSFLVIPLGNIILPMILWQTKKDKVIGLKDAGVNLLNYQIVWTVFSTLSIMNIMFAILNIPHIFSYHTVLYLFIGLNVLNVILPVYFACKSKKGETEKKYPTILRLIK
jgi:transcriptional regulator with XRE-family HTH domain